MKNEYPAVSDQRSAISRSPLVADGWLPMTASQVNPTSSLQHPASSTTLALTAGDPCGIGPEVILKALAARAIPPHVRLIVIGDHTVFASTAKRLRRPLPAWRVLPAREALSATLSEGFTFLDCGHPQVFRPGSSSMEAGKASLAYLSQAVALWRARRLHAMVTAPVTKWAVALTHPAFVGQTEYFASAMRVRDVAMMFVSEPLRVVLLTRHLPLQHVAHAITRPLIRTTLRLTSRILRERFHIRRPRLALCGLNPHAGEASQCGHEEARIMTPLLRALRKEGLICEGPFAADGFFAQMLHPAQGSQPTGRGSREYDAVVCAYHDQGLIPFKMVARDRGCQLTVGLPIIRTSPDHGTALDIAGRGAAHPGSMIYALQLAARLARGASAFR